MSPNRRGVWELAISLTARTPSGTCIYGTFSHRKPNFSKLSARGLCISKSLISYYTGSFSAKGELPGIPGNACIHTVNNCRTCILYIKKRITSYNACMYKAYTYESHTHFIRLKRFACRFVRQKKTYTVSFYNKNKTLHLHSTFIVHTFVSIGMIGTT